MSNSNIKALMQALTDTQAALLSTGYPHKASGAMSNLIKVGQINLSDCKWFDLQDESEVEKFSQIVTQGAAVFILYDGHILLDYICMDHLATEYKNLRISMHAFWDDVDLVCLANGIKPLDEYVAIAAYECMAINATEAVKALRTMVFGEGA